MSHGGCPEGAYNGVRAKGRVGHGVWREKEAQALCQRCRGVCPKQGLLTRGLSQQGCAKECVLMKPASAFVPQGVVPAIARGLNPHELEHDTSHYHGSRLHLAAITKEWRPILGQEYISDQVSQEAIPKVQDSADLGRVRGISPT